jgi:hypothetical protein
MSVGYAFSAQTDFIFDGVNGASLLGARKITTRIPSLSGLYISGDLLFNFTDRLGLSVGGRWAFPLGSVSTHEEYNGNPAIGRDWDSDRRDWVSADVLLSYILLKNVSFVKDVSLVVGFRGDYQNIKFKNAHNASGVASGMTDSVTYEIQSYSPVFGVSSTFKGFKAGIFGGDIKLALLGSPSAYTSLKYTETFASGASLNVDDRFSRTYFVNFAADVTAISAKLGSKADLSVIIFGQYTQYHMDDRVIMSTTPATSEFEYKFNASPNLAVVGIKAAVAF